MQPKTDTALKEFRKFLLKNRITPKWVIFLLDLLICIGTFIYANYLLTDFKILSLNYETLSEGVMTVCVASSVSFFIFKTYEGIIRFSEIHETIRALSAVFCSFLIMLLFNGILVLSHATLYIPNSVLFGYFFCASFVICGYRILVKTLYQDDELDINAANVIIYGAEIKGSLLQKTIVSISNKQFKVVAFIDDNEMLAGKTIDSIRIYSPDQLQSLLKPLRIKYLFFSKPDIDASVKNKIADECLVHNVKLMNIPPADRWVHGHLNFKQISDVQIEELLGRPAIELCNENVANFISNRNILITGAAGSIGSELARQVAAMHPASLILCDQVETGLHDLEYELQQHFGLGAKLKFYLGDVKDIAAMDQLFSVYRPDIVFHAAAYKHVPVMESHPSEAIRNNVLGTKVLADLSEFYGVERFLFISTDKAINPTNIMGASKRLAEIYCHSLHHSSKDIPAVDPLVYRMDAVLGKTKFITTRFGNVLASNGSVIPRFREQIAKGGPVTVTDPEIIRYFMTIPEACSLVLEAVTMGNGGEIFLFDMGEPVKILDLATKMIKLAGYEPGKDIRIDFTGLRPGEKLYEELLNDKEEVIPTHHKKILIAKVQDDNKEEIMDQIMKLIDLANECRDDDVVKQMKFILPEYISNNSVYQLYDNKFTPQTNLASSV
ncbi:polysaccharide biosynthesis protein [Panacibacter ginsenosidivorans]|uniref:Polysaccharide biosynthesis protein n=1 Tax=Panacibacter ginsenosidivorans TaxID=1813871 RepID=A0A5B8VDM7_9BACT|nr:nucleoside-diphosphate sugar epimerase/dehydratase [Panacibacter ginsenosidivorans]QEC69103.1 polysaccharide biosynthesis protein [Panacibacter ginsenosidivorans]